MDFVASTASQPTENFFPESGNLSLFPDSTSAPPAPPAQAQLPPAAQKSLGGLEDLFGGSFDVAPVSTSVTTPAPAPPNFFSNNAVAITGVLNCEFFCFIVCVLPVLLIDVMHSFLINTHIARIPHLSITTFIRLRRSGLRLLVHLSGDAGASK